MLETIFGGLVIAFISGITFVAYKEPEGYSYLFVILMAILIVGMLGSTVHDIGVTRATSKIAEVFDENDVDYDVRSLIYPATEETTWFRGWMLGVVFAYIAYSSLLMQFGKIFKTERRDDTVVELSEVDDKDRKKKKKNKKKNKKNR